MCLSSCYYGMMERELSVIKRYYNPLTSPSASISINVSCDMQHTYKGRETLGTVASPAESLNILTRE